MDRLTALERELLASVTALVNGSKHDMSTLEAGLASYDRDLWNGLEARFSEIERMQTSLSQRMRTIERQQSDLTDGLIQRLKVYEAQVKSLTDVLNKLVR